MKELKIFAEFKRYFERTFITKKYYDIKQEVCLRFPIHDKGDYFIVYYKGIQIIIYNSEDHARLCDLFEENLLNWIWVL